MPTTEIVVGLDDSPSARAALRWAARHAWITRSALRGVHVDVTRRYDEIEDAHRASITAVFDEIQPPGDWLLQFARPCGQPLEPGDIVKAFDVEAKRRDPSVLEQAERHFG